MHKQHLIRVNDLEQYAHQQLAETQNRQPEETCDVYLQRAQANFKQMVEMYPCQTSKQQGTHGSIMTAQKHQLELENEVER